VLIKKSVPNLISYLHEFFRNCSQFLAIYFELFPSGVNFNSENADDWVPPIRCRAPRRSSALKALSRPRAGVPTAPFRPRRRRCPNRLAPPRLARLDCAVAWSDADRRCPATSAVVSTSTVSVARALLSSFFVRGASSSPSPPSSPSQDRRRPP
jgi:hypothetical protein